MHLWKPQVSIEEMLQVCVWPKAKSKHIQNEVLDIDFSKVLWNSAAPKKEAVDLQYSQLFLSSIFPHYLQSSFSALKVYACLTLKFVGY